MKQVIPVPVNFGHHHPTTEQEIKVFLGGLIFLTILFLISFPIAVIRYKQGKYDKQLIENFALYNVFGVGFLRAFLHAAVILAWFCVMMSVIGEFIAKLIFN